MGSLVNNPFSGVRKTDKAGGLRSRADTEQGHGQFSHVRSLLTLRPEALAVLSAVPLSPPPHATWNVCLYCLTETILKCCPTNSDTGSNVRCVLLVLVRENSGQKLPKMRDKSCVSVLPSEGLVWPLCSLQSGPKWLGHPHLIDFVFRCQLKSAGAAALQLLHLCPCIGQWCCWVTAAAVVYSGPVVTDWPITETESGLPISERPHVASTWLLSASGRPICRCSMCTFTELCCPGQTRQKVI